MMLLKVHNFVFGSPSNKRLESKLPVSIECSTKLDLNGDTSKDGSQNSHVIEHNNRTAIKEAVDFIKELGIENFEGKTKEFPLETFQQPKRDSLRPYREEKVGEDTAVCTAIVEVMAVVTEMGIEGIVGSGSCGPEPVPGLSSKPALNNLSVENSISCSSDTQEFQLPIRNSFEALRDDTIVADSLENSQQSVNSTHTFPSLTILNQRQIQNPQRKNNSTSIVLSSLNLFCNFTARKKLNCLLRTLEVKSLGPCRKPPPTILSYEYPYLEREGDWQFPTETFGLFNLQQKLFRLEGCLKSWNKDVFGNIFSAKSKAESDVKRSRALFDSSPSEVHLIELKRCNAALNQILAMEEDFWKQKSAGKWFVNGEWNTEFFHSIVKKKRARTRIHVIEEGGVQITDFEDIKHSACS
ncbi:hypothetical protein BUALT_Bualt05G0078300 [Buddleja alternifolia]|uniref:Uncharacterized protein n=1 Tax=Buddleja alternifolia TaxID=168488 RepID=A0AAV6XTK7_9LAMI|nr:hypothetical protein BUALT_Bualt05G0078300 [Buddleja alternifolia]